MTPVGQMPRQDPMLLHVMKEMPPWVVIGLFVTAFLVVWNLSHDDFIPRIIDGLIGALLTSIVAQRPKTPAPNINAQTVETETVNAATMPDAIVNTETITLKDKPK